MHKTFAEIANNAADYIESAGWTRRQMSNDKGAVCALGAIEEVTPMHASTKEDCVPCQFKEAFKQFIGHASISNWNDERGRTKRQVIVAFRAFAKQHKGVD